MLFSLQDGHLMVTSLSKRSKALDSLEGLFNVTQNLTSHEIIRETVETDLMSVEMVCNFNKFSVDLMNEEHHEDAKQAIADVLLNDGVNIPYIIMKKYDKELLVCQLAIRNEKPYWKVIRASNFTHRELSFFISVLKRAGIYSFAKITRH